MLRVGWFWELDPSSQKLFDRLIKILEQTYQKWGYDHIYTPAVEKNEVLLAKGGEEVSGQIFGLYGLKQWCEKDKKDYSLHFDLTVPLARYVLDRRNELRFPFKRYQIQPVWRWERQQKGRFREFFQADIDTIFEGDGPLWYDIETLLVIGEALKYIFEEFDLKEQIIIKINSKKIINSLIKRVGLNEQASNILGLLDKYYKLDSSDFESMLYKIAWKEKWQQLLKLVTDGDSLLDILEEWTEIRSQLDELKKWKHSLWLDKMSFEFDPFIVRWLDYYTGMVFETFVDGKRELGSIASGGRYEGLTSYIQPKTNFGGVWWSIGVNRLFSWIKQIVDVDWWQDKYLITRFEGIDITEIVNKLLNEKKEIEIYPNTDGLKKQFKFANKKKIRYVVVVGEEEVGKGVYKIKDLKSGEEKSYPLKISDET